MAKKLEGIIGIDKDFMKKEVERLEKNFNKSESTIKLNLTNLSQSFGDEIAEMVRKEAPKESGNLRKSISAPRPRFLRDEIDIKIRVDAEYGQTMNLGWNVDKIVPKKKKFLKIPYGKKGGIKRLYRGGMSPKKYDREVKRAKKKGAIFRKVVIPRKAAEGTTGPNLYLERVLDKIPTYSDSVLRRIVTKAFKGTFLE